MNTILRKFITEPLFGASAALLDHLHIQFNNDVTRTPVSFESLHPMPLTKALQAVLPKVERTYFIGTVDEASLSGHAEGTDIDDVTSQAAEGRYAGMMIFAVDVYSGESLTRTEMATLTRGFNRIAAAQPVILFVRLGNQLALATCERSDYAQQWRDGEKLGKVSILRGINCEHPHRGHIDILESIGDKPYPTFEELYKHWMQVFSSELLTKKFYSELSDWYARAVQVARFPNDLNTNQDDAKFNHESCIRLITRLIFVWFLKQKHLIPEEFFDEQYIREHFIDEFNPHERKTLLYDSEQSKYYRLILQNLFFAMLNCPIVADGEDAPNNRRFRNSKRYGFYNTENDINNLMRYKDDFKEGGADEFMALANRSVPFLNGGLFDCLDDKPNKMYYDGFSEYKRSLEQLYLPDWLFFGDEVGRIVDLSQWYGDAKKKKVSARGLIDILKRYNFTIEENTPLDQEVSLDPELLGKAFENLLASYNPETKTSARKQTGSFYTPREIVQYMVDESLVAHLKRTCGDELETEYRRLLNYSTEETTLNEEQRRQVMHALYNCRVLDPACGSGAFPMGVLQQMVHILRKLDPTNEMWKDFMIDLAIEQSRVAFSADAEEERKARLADIEEAFNRNINDPDYARKLYLIEHCIYGVDIQPIAVQISKLRFFISLVVDQKPTMDATQNFGIRPLPNLESKFVAANTLIPIEYDATIVDGNPEVRQNKDRLKELNHKCFLVKRKAEKDRLKRSIKETRAALARAIEDTGFVGHSEAELLAGWNMFDQNASSSYFDAEWMFGVKGGFDIVIANPPYVLIQALNNDLLERTYKKLYSVASYKIDLFHLFIERGIIMLKTAGILTYINPTTYLTNNYTQPLRDLLLNKTHILAIINISDNVFNASVNTGIEILQKIMPENSVLRYYFADYVDFNLIVNLISSVKQSDYLKAEKHIIQPIDSKDVYNIIQKIEKLADVLKKHATVNFGMQLRNRKIFVNDVVMSDSPESLSNYHRKCLTGKDISNYVTRWNYRYCYFNEEARCGGCWIESVHNAKNKLLVRQVGSIPVCGIDTEGLAVLNSAFMIVCKDINPFGVLGIINSKLIQFYWGQKFEDKRKTFPKIKGTYLELLPIVNPTTEVIHLVMDILKAKEADLTADTKSLEDKIDFFVYHLYGLIYDEVLIIDPETPITREEYESQKVGI